MAFANRRYEKCGSVHAGGGTSDPTDHYEVDSANGVREAKVFTRRNAPEPSSTAGEYYRPAADATWPADAPAPVLNRT